MSSNIAISVQEVSKVYQLGTNSGGLREAVSGIFKKKTPDQSGEFWALKDVSFDIHKGDVIGLIGRNGAGKSTLLKVLSKITVPSSGRIEISGRIASLLEVGTGFHPELTGKENIFLNGTILGMSRNEVKAKYDEIVEFSGIEKFLDTPVKRYSSGMYVRLAFAVAAHLEPEILVIDEVLAVGDAEFQKKCLGKMEAISSTGRTVVFVSHNMGAVRELCNKGVFLQNGQVQFVGGVEQAIEQYEKSYAVANENAAAATWTFDKDDEKEAQIRQVDLVNSAGKPSSVIDIMEDFKFQVQVDINTPSIIMNLQMRVYRGVECLLTTLDEDHGIEVKKTAGRYTYEISVPGRFLKAGKYSIDLVANRPPEGTWYDQKTGQVVFEISEEKHHLAHNGFVSFRDGNVIFPGTMTIAPK